MPRQRCCGWIEDEPKCREFLPTTPYGGQAVVIQLEELEAIRLKDVKGLEQADCATTMGLSRPTYQRILQSARTKIATALVAGCPIQIEGGNYVMKNRVFECVACKHVWEEIPCTAGGKHGYEIACPTCGAMEKTKLENGVKHACGGHHHEHGHGHGCCGGHK